MKFPHPDSIVAEIRRSRKRAPSVRLRYRLSPFKAMQHAGSPSRQEINLEKFEPRSLSHVRTAATRCRQRKSGARVLIGSAARIAEKSLHLWHGRIRGCAVATDGWPTQAWFWLGWGSSTAGQSLPAARSRRLAVHSHSISTRPCHPVAHARKLLHSQSSARAQSPRFTGLW